MGNKRGQYFLIAAIVIIVVVVSIITVSNYTQRKDVTRLYDLGQELGIESQNVIDYGTYNSQSPSEMNTMMLNFISNYRSYIGTDKNVYFAFGNKNNISVIGYQQAAESESVCIKIDSGDCVPYVGGEKIQEFTGAGMSKAAIVIGDVQYEFKLREGENFYFVIWQRNGGEKNVVTNSV